ncbi:MAG: hypothetical protein PWP37_1322 [Thermotogota bacterium]|nr:hypothetical protein [Thermotogota bacterium]MDK2865130.1 hypothetical protein [Thermotogota bacterium]
MDFRGAVERAVKMEEASYNFYANLADVVEDRSIAEFAKELAEWELSHKEKLLSLLDGEISTEELGKQLPQTLGIAELFDEDSHAPGKDVKLEELLRFGITKEKKAAKLYESLKIAVDDPVLVELFDKLRSEELTHQEKLEKLYEDMILEGP